MNRRLLALDTAENIPLKVGLIVVGRHPSCDFRIRSPRISRVHCCFHTEGGRIFVRDLNSTNGVRVNGNSVVHSELNPGDVVSIAQMHFKCVECEDTPTETRNSERESLVLTDRGPIAQPRENPVAMPMPEDLHESSVEIRIRTGS